MEAFALRCLWSLALPPFSYFAFLIISYICVLVKSLWQWPSDNFLNFLQVFLAVASDPTKSGIGAMTDNGETDEQGTSGGGRWSGGPKQNSW
jgi:hypothetical protein